MRGTIASRRWASPCTTTIWLLALLQLAWLGWLFSFPVALDSDDALNFAHGVTRFSVLEFSPHFPGYPVFIWLARLLNLGLADPIAAVHYASLLGTAPIPPLLAWLVVRRWQAPTLLAPLWLLGLGLPLVPALGLAGLSDGPALAAWLGALLALTPSGHSPLSARRLMLAGLLVGIMLGLRPSYFVLALLPGLLGWQGGRIRFLLLPILLVGLLCLAFVWQGDGWAYFSEGRRFTSGHFTLWGNTAVAHGDRLLSWAQTLNTQFSPLWPLALPLIGLGLRNMVAASGRALASRYGLSWLALLLWTLFGQNPDNPRHLAPLLLLSLLLAAGALVTPGKTGAGWGRRLASGRSSPGHLGTPFPLLLCLLGLWLLCTTLTPARPAALYAAKQLAEQRCPALVTQWGVRLLREQSSLAITDAWYEGDARLALAEGACRLSRRPLSELTTRNPPLTPLWFAPRFRAEPGLWLGIPPS